jgi:hypothetical protein
VRDGEDLKAKTNTSKWEVLITSSTLDSVNQVVAHVALVFLSKRTSVDPQASTTDVALAITAQTNKEMLF